MVLRRGVELLADHEQVLLLIGDDLNPTTDAALGELTACEGALALVLERGHGILWDGLQAVWGRAQALPYERTQPVPLPRAYDAALGLHAASGVLTALVTGEPVREHDDGLHIPFQIVG